MKKRLWIWLLAVAAVVIVFAWIFWANTALVLTRITVKSDALPEAFSGFRIAHVSDLHNAAFGEGNVELLQMLSDTNPDIIAMTGDLIDSRNTDLESALSFAREAVKIAPCYYVTGNHEAAVTGYPAFEDALREAGVTVLKGEGKNLWKDGQSIQILGVDDYYFYSGADAEESVAAMIARAVEAQEAGFNVLLFHRPELVQRLEDLGFELVLSGHAHGGQVRIPFLGGLIAPDQGFFPEYTEGLHTFGMTQMVVSRGLGNSLIPIRVNNRPEVVLITLERENENA